MDKGALSIGVITLIILAIFFVTASSASKKELSVSPHDRCVQHSGGISYHVHPIVEIYERGKKIEIPSDIGISPTCMKSIHTHDTSGTIHVEAPEAYDFTLGDFFANWGQTLSKEQLLEFKSGDGGTISMKVNGQPSTEFEKLVLKDKDLIELRYE